MSRKHEECSQAIRGQSQAQGFYKTPSGRKAEELLNLSRNWLPRMMELLTGHFHLKAHLYFFFLNPFICHFVVHPLHTSSVFFPMSHTVHTVILFFLNDTLPPQYATWSTPPLDSNLSDTIVHQVVALWASDPSYGVRLIPGVSPSMASAVLTCWPRSPPFSRVGFLPWVLVLVREGGNWSL